MSDNDKDEDIERVRLAVAQLGEHFETVQVFVTKVLDDVDDAGGTVAINRGTGNWHARDGQVREWVIQNEERARLDVRRENEE